MSGREVVSGRVWLGALIVATLVVAAVVLVRSGATPGDVAVPPRLTIGEPVVTLSRPFDRAAVVEERADDPVRAGEIQPGEPLRGAGLRPAVVVPPRTRLRWQVQAGEGQVLLFAAGVGGIRDNDRGHGGVRFSVTVNGREAWARVVNPARGSGNRRWYDGRVELPATPTEVVLGTDVERTDLPVAGVPGWSEVRIARERSRERQPARPEAPNLLVLLVDTLRADRLGCYGASPSPSPTLDALAATGTLFEHTMSQSSWTLASVASLLSGRYPRSHGVIRDRPAAGAGAPPGGTVLDEAVVTWPEAAEEAGITTIGVSSNPLVSRVTNLGQGFETFVETTWDPKRRNWTPAAEINRVFLRWAARNRGYRFAAYLHYMEPHDPYTPPPALHPPPPPGIAPALAAGWVRDVANRINWHGAPLLGPVELGYLRRLYDGEIGAWDAELAHLLAGLGQLGLRDSTIVIVTADHGEEFQEHGMLTHGAHLYEESLHVPLVLAGPGIEAARRTDLAQGIDLFPTVAGRLGLARPADLPGRDLLATRTVTAPAVAETARGIAPDGSPLDVIAVRTASWKLLRTPTSARDELYDLAADPGEHEPGPDGPGQADALRNILARWEATTAPPAWAAQDDPAMTEKLRALGYVE